jgi:hypothetical protein
MNSLSDFAIVTSVQQQHKLKEMPDGIECQPPLGGKLSFFSKPFARLLFIIVFLPCILPIWLILMPFRLARKADGFKERFKAKSTSKKQ